MTEALLNAIEGETSQKDELALVTQCKAGDEAACRRLYLRHAPAVYRWARRLGTPSAELPDVTQEVFTKAFRNLDRFHDGQFVHWLSRICTNVVTDHHRRRRVREAFGLRWSAGAAEAAEDPEGALRQVQAEGQVSEILARMRPKHREVFVLFELERLSGEQIALQLGCPKATVRTRLFHAREAFLRIGRRRGIIEGATESDAGDQGSKDDKGVT
jgi:RNA polymerase sigma-70 factor (ECF subfamily)